MEMIKADYATRGKPRTKKPKCKHVLNILGVCIKCGHKA